MGERPSLAQPDLSLGLDDTLRLSNDYLSNLTDAVSEIRISQTYNASTTPGAIPAPEPEQHSQLLILSTYVCLIELYKKTLQHVKAWTEARLNTDTTALNKTFPTQLTSVTIGSYQLPASSPMQTLVLVGTIEGILAKISDLVDEIMRPARSPHEPPDTPGAAIYKEDTSPPSAPSSVAQASLQAIRGQEDAIMALVQEVWALAVRCRAS
ncbi:hypothetical protein KVR01_011803 [Diaporthe batatas]|uniref:uncharacterized protein n=1 Tax=Diaporthe batatas TaxID=748121 RepID=UPI001D0398EF|nr:uncharacterized protein KVR01_011803 [Diaporthe batatas]KAG8158681.1 hypothetical protein KVR01_011803 [Diaporthe batatas]